MKQLNKLATSVQAINENGWEFNGLSLIEKLKQVEKIASKMDIEDAIDYLNNITFEDGVHSRFLGLYMTIEQYEETIKHLINTDDLSILKFGKYENIEDIILVMDGDYESIDTFESYQPIDFVKMCQDSIDVNIKQLTETKDIINSFNNFVENVNNLIKELKEDDEDVIIELISLELAKVIRDGSGNFENTSFINLFFNSFKEQGENDAVDKVIDNVNFLVKYLDKQEEVNKLKSSLKANTSTSTAKKMKI